MTELLSSWETAQHSFCTSFELFVSLRVDRWAWLWIYSFFG